MKLAIVSRFFPKDVTGGSEEVIFNIWQRAKKKYDVSLISGWKNNPDLLPKESLKIDLRNKNRFIRYYKLYTGSKKILKKIKPDLIHSNCMEIPHLDIPTVMTIHHLSHLLGIGKSSMHRIQKFLVKKRLKKVDRIVAVSKATKRDIIKLGIKAEKISVIYNGIDTKKFKPKKTKNKKFTIVYPSRISEEKGQHIAVESLNLLKKNIRTKINLILVGFVSNEKYLEQIRRLSKNLSVTIKTNVPNIVEYYQKADLIIFPTLLSEGFGLIAGEALACGKPVICSDFPAIREVVGNYGLYIKPNSADSLARAIQEIYYNKELRKSIEVKSRQYIKNRFNWDLTFKNYQKIYEELLKCSQ